MRNRSDPKLLIGVLFMLLGLTVRFGNMVYDALMRLPAGSMVWVILFVAGFCCTGFYFFEKMMTPDNRSPAMICPACRQSLQSPFHRKSICPVCGEVISLHDHSTGSDGKHTPARQFDRQSMGESFWGSKRSVPIVLPLYLMIVALIVYLAQNPGILSDWYENILNILQL